MVPIGLRVPWIIRVKYLSARKAFNCPNYEMVYWSLTASWVPYESTHWWQVTHKCVTELCNHWFRKWLFLWSAPNQYKNHCWLILNWTIGYTFQWNFNWETIILIGENAMLWWFKGDDTKELIHHTWNLVMTIFSFALLLWIESNLL